MTRLRPAQARTALIGLRGALALGWAAPGTLAGIFGIDAAAQPDLPYLLRLFTIRDGALAFLAAASRGDARRLVLRTGVVVDAADTVAAVLAGASRKTPAKAAAMAALTAGAATALGVVALQE